MNELNGPTCSMGLKAVLAFLAKHFSSAEHLFAMHWQCLCVWWSGKNFTDMARLSYVTTQPATKLVTNGNPHLTKNQSIPSSLVGKEKACKRVIHVRWSYFWPRTVPCYLIQTIYLSKNGWVSSGCKILHVHNTSPCYKKFMKTSWDLSVRKTVHYCTAKIGAH